MKYRAILIDLTAHQREAKAQQSISNSLEDLDHWASATLQKVAVDHPDPTALSIVIYQQYEKPIRTMTLNLAGDVHE